MPMTPAIQHLDRSGVPHQTHEYEVSEQVGEGYGEAVARAIGLPAPRVFKTLVARVDDAPVVAVIPVDHRLSTKLLAKAVGGKRAALASPEEAERLTGYVVGGISPFGQKRRLPLYLDRSADNYSTIAVSGGRRGVQLELTPADLLRVTGGAFADLTDH
ncbi:MAG: Cys-tRNA(Pro) deacylase [Acidimicrobiia bacterium]